jgi:hypothetical protein
MRRGLLSLILIGLLAACSGQTPPARDSLPDVGVVVPVALPCGFLLGEGLGVSIEDVISGGASEGKLEAGDLLVGLNGAEVMNAEQLRTALSDKAVGEEIAIEVIRSGEPMSVAVVLGANPDDPERPLLGVMIETSFERIEATTLEDEIEGGALVRVVGMGNGMYVLNPETAEWGALDAEVPGAPWTAAAGGVFTITDPDTDDAALLDAISGDRILFDVADWQGSRALGSLGDKVLVSAARLAPGEDELFQISVLLINVQSRNATWIWVVDDPDIGVPVASFPSPDGTRVLLAGQGQEDQVIRYLILSSEANVIARPDQLADAEGTIAVGWFDDEQVLLRDSQGALHLLDASTGIATPATIPAVVGTISRAWAVGDGRTVLADTGSSLIRFEVGGSQEVRTLADRCQIDQLSDIGWSG